MTGLATMGAGLIESVNSAPTIYLKTRVGQYSRSWRPAYTYSINGIQQDEPYSRSPFKPDQIFHWTKSLVYYTTVYNGSSYIAKPMGSIALQTSSAQQHQATRHFSHARKRERGDPRCFL